MRQEAQQPEAILYRDNNDSFAGHVLPVKLDFVGITALIAAAMDVEQNRQLFVAPFGGGEDVYIKAVFTHLKLWAGRMQFLGPKCVGIKPGHILYGHGAVLGGRTYALPRGDGLRGAPTQFPYGRCRIGHTFEDCNARVIPKITLKFPGLNSYIFQHEVSPFCLSTACLRWQLPSLAFCNP